MITLPLRTLLLVPALALLAGCGSVVVGDECKETATCEVCVADGQEYEVGFAYADYCGSCVCQEDGEFHCTQSGECTGPTCRVGDVEYPEGASWDDPSGCGGCSCFAGEVTCEAFACPVCTWDGQEYYAGDEFPAGDGCNTCMCEETGEVSCTLIACAPTCSWGGQEYAAGESFPAGDGCNTCTCGDDGSVSCTEIACACDPMAEWWRSYVTTNPAECALIDYTCPGATTSFQNACGCGCEQSLACPQFFDCKPPSTCDLDWIAENCPYSVVGL